MTTKTNYFTFGSDHVHTVGGFTYDKDIVVKITTGDPRATMFQTFGSQWSFQYDEKPKMQFFPRGIKEL